jgi:hypothetical protein
MGTPLGMALNMGGPIWTAWHQVLCRWELEVVLTILTMHAGIGTEPSWQPLVSHRNHYDKDSLLSDMFLLQKLLAAIEEFQVHNDLLKTMERAVAAANPTLLDAWEEHINIWEQNLSQTVDCPYVPQHTCW